MTEHREEIRLAITDTTGIPRTDADALAGVLEALLLRWVEDAYKQGFGHGLEQGCM